MALLTNGVFPFVVGGMQKHSYALAKNFANSKINVDVYHFRKEENKTIALNQYFSDEELRRINFIEITFPVFRHFIGHYIYASFCYSKALYENVINKDYDCIYAQGFTSWYFLKREASLKVKLITNLHGLEMYQPSINLKNKLEQCLLKIPAKKIIQNSKANISLGGKLTSILYTNGAPENSVIELPNGIDDSWIIDENAIAALNQEGLKFLFVGRYERRKGIEELLEVIERTISNENYEISFIGPIPKNKQIDHPRVMFKGLIADVDLLKNEFLNADILVCPSYSEGMPTVILEAMASGCAIIATNVGAVSTMVDDQNGWLIEGDIKIGLDRVITEALHLDEKELRDKKLVSINRVSEKFTWERVIKQTIEAIYHIKY
ncbi:hypothetical protein A9996_09465 [Gelidibacter algens]|nr:hypothetical protein A9996_09465 [Gelidibacter algens]